MSGVREQVDFDDGRVSVSPTILRIGRATLPIAGITSVEIRNPDISGFIGFTMVLALVSVGAVVSGFVPYGVGGLAICALCAFGMAKEPQQLVVCTSSGAFQKVVGHKADLAKIELAIEVALEMRS